MTQPSKICEACGGDPTIDLYYKTDDKEIVLPCSCQPPSGKEPCKSKCPDRGKTHKGCFCYSPAPTNEGEKGEPDERPGFEEREFGPEPQEAHPTEQDYCCACGYDIAGFEERLAKERSLAAKEMLGKAIGVVEEQLEKTTPIHAGVDQAMGYESACEDILDRLRELESK